MDHGSVRPLLFLLASLLLPTSALASPWTMPKGKVAVQIGADVQFARKEWLIDGRFQRYPLQGRYFGANLRIGARHGITDRLEIGGRISITHLSYDSDELVMPAEGGGEPTIISFDRRATGPGDVQLYGRYRISKPGRVAAAIGLEAKLPTGYPLPRGTFIGDDPTAGVGDDVAIGDGQLDLTPRMHLGFVPLDFWFVRMAGGIRFRFFGPGQQLVGEVKTGFKLGKHVLVYGGVDAEHSFTDGKVIGQTFVTSDVESNGEQLDPADIETLDLRLDRSALRPAGGVLLLFANWELDIGYQVIAYGRNIAQTQAISLGVTVKP